MGLNELLMDFNHKKLCGKKFINRKGTLRKTLRESANNFAKLCGKKFINRKGTLEVLFLK